MNPKSNLLKALDHEEPEWVPTPMVDGSMTVVTHDLQEYPPGGGIDDWGVKWKQGEEESGAGLPITHPIQNPAEIEDYPFPDPGDTGLMDPALEAISSVDRGKTLVFGDNGWGLFERAWILVGMDRFLMWMYREPEAVDMLLGKIAEVKVKITERLIDEVGVDGVRYGDDWGGESELMMGPDLWRKFIKPRQKLLYDACNEEVKLVMQHADGHIEEVIPDLIEMGLDLLNPLQPECNDVESVKREYGARLSFHGTVSSRVLDKGTTSEVRSEVEIRVDKLSTGGGYVLAPAHAYSYSEENIKAFRDAAVEYGRIPDKWVRKSSNKKGDIEL
ncbi:MAG: uroporphyrinogen decarboxylase family protein [Candidatus Bipolaricaulota bacterium]|nr:hypothetical protein [Candidatus Bipolaricaulota bacterium]MBS3792056.1 hypothetical protein [Candidatus Bipolaricaulota bacterium]